MGQSQKKRERRALLGDRTIRDSVERLTAYEASCADAIPTWWELMDHVRSAKRSTLALELPGGWPDWCLFPTPALHAVIPTPGKIGEPPSQMRNALIARMLGLYAWSQGRTVWRFDPDVATALVETEDMGRVPAEVLRRLPQWGVYIQRPDVAWPDSNDPPAGVLARLTTQAMFDFEPTRAPVLEIQYDLPRSTGIGLGLSLVPLVPGLSLNEALVMVRENLSRRNGVDMKLELDLEEKMLRPWLALLMYLCSQGADTEGRGNAPSEARPRTTGAPDLSVSRVDVGFRVGAAIRQSRAQHAGPDTATGRSVSPHLRRAHFHTFYSGPGSKSDPSKRVVEVKWLPPIPVGVGDVSPVVRPVAGDIAKSP